MFSLQVFALGPFGGLSVGDSCCLPAEGTNRVLRCLTWGLVTLSLLSRVSCSVAWAILQLVK